MTDALHTDKIPLKKFSLKTNKSDT